MADPRPPASTHPASADTERADAMQRYQELRGAAASAAAGADEARALAGEIGRRRMLLLTRDDPVLAHHTSEVWSSQAAARSREELQRVVGFALWTAGEDLATTERLLLARADTLAAEAGRAYRLADEALAATTRPSRPPLPLDQATTFFTSNPAPRGNR